MVLAQYNESTGKASFTAGTNKQQQFSPIIPQPEGCADCDPYPSQIKVTFDSVTSRDGCYISTSGAPNDYSFENVPDINNEYTLDGSETEDCVWESITPLPEWMIRTIWNTTDGTCVTFISSFPADLLVIRVFRTPFGSVLTAKLVFADIPLLNSVMFDSRTFTPDSDCLNAVSIANAQVASDKSAGYGGTADIEDLS